MSPQHFNLLLKLLIRVRVLEEDSVALYDQIHVLLRLLELDHFLMQAVGLGSTELYNVPLVAFRQLIQLATPMVEEHVHLLVADRKHID